MQGASDLAPIDVHCHGRGGSTVAVLHGGPGAPGSVCSLARLLATGHTVVEPLQRRAGGPPLTVQRHVEDHAVVLPPRVAVVGWSWGAMLALSYAAAYPDRVASLALVGCGTYDSASREVYRQRMSRRLAERLGAAGGERVEELSRQLAATTDPAERDRLTAELGHLAGIAQGVDAEPDHTDEPVDAAGQAETWADVLRRQDDGEEPAAFAAIRCPVLMLHGGDDPHPGTAIRDVLRPHIPHLQYVEFAACGHAPWLERRASDEFLRVLRSWLEG